VDEFMDIIEVWERVLEANMSRFLDEPDHHLFLTGFLHEARELICSSLELADTPYLASIYSLRLSYHNLQRVPIEFTPRLAIKPRNGTIGVKR
jgi:hypothetical protein